MKNMRINKVSYKDQIFHDYSVIIDVRTPSEFLEDHIPNSINYPVLSDKQRHEIGISYKENSFLAKKNGAELISFNISKIIKKIKFCRPLSHSGVSRIICICLSLFDCINTILK